MRMPDLALTRYVARWAPAADHDLCSSDVEAWRLEDLLGLADEDARASWGGLGLGYTPAAGAPELREAIAGLYEGPGADGVACFTGAEEALFALVNVMLGRGDHAVAVSPGYAPLHEVARAAGAQVTLVPLEEGRAWELPLDRLRAAVGPTTRLLILNFPHNPTGALPTEARFREMLEVAEAAGARVLSDESYRLLERDPRDRLPAACELSRSAVSVAGLSKPFGLAGLRVGWAVCRDRELLARASAFRDWLSACTAAPSQALAMIALGARETMLRRSRSLIADNLARLEHLVGRRPGVLSWAPPRAGATAFLRLGDGLDADAFAAALREREGVLVLPGSLYGAPGHLRVGVGGSGFVEALGRLEAFTATWTGEAARGR